ncbi:MAG: SDR family oxidoreductase [Alphaproteobacteria bacterium]|nr:SDR family oxidoreductase [Alphaproteobacteria bacterium]
MGNTLFDCTGKVTMVTGGNSGLGLGFAMGCAKMGGDVAIWARNEEKSRTAREKLLAAGAGRVEYYSVDVASEEQVIEGYRQLKADFGRVDCVFANSGRGPGAPSFLELNSDEWHDLLSVSLHGAFYTLREGAKLMVERAQAGEPGGSLVQCGSLTIFQGLKGLSNYAAAKAGMAAVIRCMAVELGEYQIRCNTLAVGFTITDMITRAGPEFVKGMEDFFAARTPIPRAGYIEDIEGMAAYLCSDASRYHSGDTITVDGGSAINPVYSQ